jgi:hypothetical protein
MPSVGLVFIHGINNAADPIAPYSAELRRGIAAALARQGQQITVVSEDVIWSQVGGDQVKGLWDVLAEDGRLVAPRLDPERQRALPAAGAAQRQLEAIGEAALRDAAEQTAGAFPAVRGLPGAAALQQAIVTALVRYGAEPLARAARTFLLAAAADILLYQEPDRQRWVWGRVAAAIAAVLEQAGAPGTEVPVSIIAHSMGTVVAHDFLYALKRRTPDVLDALPDALRRRVEAGWRPQHLMTMGSPIAPLLLRDVQVEIPLPVPTVDLYGDWVNFFEPGDPIAFPLGRVLPRDHILDLEVQSVGLPHLGYWRNVAVAQEIASLLSRAG